MARDPLKTVKALMIEGLIAASQVEDSQEG